MGLTPPGTGSLLSSVDQKAAYEAFKASRSFDPDALYAQKEAMLAPYRNLKRVATIGAVAGGLLTVTLGTPVFGILVVAGSWLIWRFQSRQTRNIEAGYAQYVGAGEGDR